MQKSIYTLPHQQLCAWLRKRREDQQLNVRELAQRLEIHHSKIVRVEGGRQRLDVVEFVRWCVALQANPRELVGELWIWVLENQPVTSISPWKTEKKAAETANTTYNTRRKRPASPVTPAARGR